ncbi:MAG: dihydroneopterin aldolase [Candidatus Latescibacteria bacterium]|nr:dihydroneopterin aldolase [bacterium]MBD3423582.1 dihydroneopterin aldolase [Candidatus Latescibacterota bacterium]
MLEEKVVLKGITVFGYYGVSRMEREIGQKLEIDIEYYHDFTKASMTDSLEDTVNYERVYSRVMEVVENNKFNLLETLANAICREVLENFPIIKIRTEIRKLTLPFPNSLSHVAVVVEREAE